MNDTQKRALATIVVIVIAVALLYGLRWFVEKFPPRQQETAQDQSATINQMPVENTASIPAQPVTQSGDAKTAYQQALDKYTFRIQFKDCRGIGEPPSAGGSLVLKKGTPLMLDNRDKIAHTIAFKGVSVKVGAENFAIVTPTVLGIYNVTCDGGGSASLNVEQ